jgi:hypothetical protein
MSGPLMVPAAIAAAFVENPLAKGVFATTAVFCFVFSSYWVWKIQRERVLALAEKLRPKIIVLGLHESITAFTNGFERTIELEIQNDSGEPLDNCLAVVTDISATKMMGLDGVEIDDATSMYKGHLPKALLTARNLERGTGGPFNLRAGQKKKIPICTRLDGHRSDLRVHYELGGESYLYLMASIVTCDMEITFYGAPAPTVERVHFRINEADELKGFLKSPEMAH